MKPNCGSSHPSLFPEGLPGFPDIFVCGSCQPFSKNNPPIKQLSTFFSAQLKSANLMSPNSVSKHELSTLESFLSFMRSEIRSIEKFLDQVQKKTKNSLPFFLKSAQNSKAALVSVIKENLDKLAKTPIDFVPKNLDFLKHFTQPDSVVAILEEAIQTQEKLKSISMEIKVQSSELCFFLDSISTSKPKPIRSDRSVPHMKSTPGSKPKTARGGCNSNSVPKTPRILKQASSRNEMTTHTINLDLSEGFVVSRDSEDTVIQNLNAIRKQSSRFSSIFSDPHGPYKINVELEPPTLLNSNYITQIPVRNSNSSFVDGSQMLKMESIGASFGAEFLSSQQKIFSFDRRDSHPLRVTEFGQRKSSKEGPDSLRVDSSSKKNSSRWKSNFTPFDHLSQKLKEQISPQFQNSKLSPKINDENCLSGKLLNFDRSKVVPSDSVPKEEFLSRLEGHFSKKPLQEVSGVSIGPQSPDELLTFRSILNSRQHSPSFQDE